MEEKKMDRRILKTKKAIKNAFIKLSAEKEFNEISIKDVADMADVDRKTVYNYYDGIYAIRDELENEIIQLMNDAFKKIDFQKNISNPQHIFEVITEIINNHIDFCKNIFKLDNKSNMVQKMINLLNQKVKDCFQNSKLSIHGNDRSSMVSSFIIAGMMRVYQNWFNSGCEEELDKLSKDLAELILYGFSPLINQAQ